MPSENCSQIEDYPKSFRVCSCLVVISASNKLCRRFYRKLATDEETTLALNILLVFRNQVSSDALTLLCWFKVIRIKAEGHGE